MENWNIKTNGGAINRKIEKKNRLTGVVINDQMSVLKIIKTQKAKGGWTVTRITKQAGQGEVEIKNIISDGNPGNYEWDYNDFKTSVTVGYRKIKQQSK